MGNLGERRRHKAAIGFYAVTRWLSSVAATASRRCTSWLRKRPLRHQALAVRRLLEQWIAWKCCGLAQCRKVLSAVPVIVCGGIQHNGVLCKAQAPEKLPPFGFAQETVMSCALRVNAATQVKVKFHHLL